MTMVLERPAEDVAEPELSPRVRAVVDQLLAEDAFGPGLEAGLQDAIESQELLPAATVHVCSASDTDERWVALRDEDFGEALDAFDSTKSLTFERWITRERILVKLGFTDARSLAMGSLTDLVYMLQVGVGGRRVRDLGLLVVYSHEVSMDGHHGGRKRVPIADIDAFVDQWANAIVQLSTSHSHQGYTEGDQQSDDLLGPMLRAPIADIRQWATKLAERLENDERVPFLIWSGFRRAIEPLILATPAGAALELKTTLAREVAELAEAQLSSAELVGAIAGALQWRPPKELENVKAALKTGTQRPRLKGGQSCLFLEVGSARVVL